jgi:hypothetical protein
MSPEEEGEAWYCIQLFVPYADRSLTTVIHSLVAFSLLQSQAS